MAAWVNPKAKSFHQGRQLQKPVLRQTFPLSGINPLVWFHCASLGEFEQGRPVIESLKASRPDVKILLTFFSPSGYEVRKNYAHADFVFYLPWDTEKNAQWFLNIIRPSLVVFVKYEFWYNYSLAIRQRNIPLISISAIFRPDQVFFKFHGYLFRQILRNFTHFFVQNDASLSLLKSIGITGATVAGDTRFDRVASIVKLAEPNAVAQRFKDGKKVIVIGSAWPADMEVLLPFMKAQKGLMKFIVAPHEIDEQLLASIENKFAGETLRYSRAKETQGVNPDILLIDQIGILAQLYRYAEFAFVGGGFREGLHNILEAACYGIPVFFGNRAYDKFEEATDLVKAGGAFAVGDSRELTQKFQELNQSPEQYRVAASVTRDYVQRNLGATGIIVEYCKKTLVSWKAA